MQSLDIFWPSAPTDIGVFSLLQTCSKLDVAEFPNFSSGTEKFSFFFLFNYHVLKIEPSYYLMTTNCHCLQIGESNLLGSDLLSNQLSLFLCLFFPSRNATDKKKRRTYINREKKVTTTRRTANTTTKAVATKRQPVCRSGSIVRKFPGDCLLSRRKAIS